MKKIITGNWGGEPIWRYPTAGEALAKELAEERAKELAKELDHAKNT